MFSLLYQSLTDFRYVYYTTGRKGNVPSHRWYETKLWKKFSLPNIPLHGGPATETVGTGNIERGPRTSFYLHDFRPDVSFGVSRSSTSVALHAVLVLKTRYTGTCRTMVAKVGHVTLGSPAPPCWCPVSWPCSRHSCPCGTCCIHRSARHSSRWSRFSFVSITNIDNSSSSQTIYWPLKVLVLLRSVHTGRPIFFLKLFFIHSKNIPIFLFCS